MMLRKLLLESNGKLVGSSAQQGFCLPQALEYPMHLEISKLAPASRLGNKLGETIG